jgi:hypothetical protein
VNALPCDFVAAIPVLLDIGSKLDASRTR